MQKTSHAQVLLRRREIQSQCGYKNALKLLGVNAKARLDLLISDLTYLDTDHILIPGVKGVKEV